MVSEEHKKTNYSGNLPSEEADSRLQADVDSTARSDDSDSIDDTRYQVFIKCLYELLKDDDDATLLLMAYEEIALSEDTVKPQEAAKRLSVPIEKVRITVRRIHRAADSIKSEIFEEV